MRFVIVSVTEGEDKPLNGEGMSEYLSLLEAGRVAARGTAAVAP